MSALPLASCSEVAGSANTPLGDPVVKGCASSVSTLADDTTSAITHSLSIGSSAAALRSTIPPVSAAAQAPVPLLGALGIAAQQRRELRRELVRKDESDGCTSTFVRHNVRCCVRGVGTIQIYPFTHDCPFVIHDGISVRMTVVIGRGQCLVLSPRLIYRVLEGDLTVTKDYDVQVEMSDALAAVDLGYTEVY